MASMANAFSILVSGEQPSQNASKNKKKKNKSKQKTTADEGAPAVSTETVLAETTVEVVELADAVPILEKSARTQGPNRIKLWKDWQRQVGAGQAGWAGRLSVFAPTRAGVGCMLMCRPCCAAACCRPQTGAPRPSSTGHQMAASSSSGR